ncbi:MAG: asparagine synthase-related protein [Balneolaceae bacterium]
MRKFIVEDGKSYDSFLECVDDNDYSVQNLDPISILSFLIFGKIFFDETLISGIKKEFSHQKYYLDPKNGFCDISSDDTYLLPEKDISDYETRFLSFFKSRIDQLNNRNISADLTGGADSRLIVSLLHHFNTPFHLLYSLGSGNKKEAEITKKVASQLGKKITILSPPQILDQTLLEELFQLSDAHWDLLTLKPMRYSQKWRRENGFDLALTGVGGAIFKDFFWQQDFPFYHKKSINLERLIKLRFHPFELNHQWLTEKYSQKYYDLFSTLTNNLQTFKRRKNSYTYDQIYLNVWTKELDSVIHHAAGHYIDVYSPFLEHPLLDIGYNLPRRHKFFNGFHRKIQTEINPRLAKLSTSSGNMTVSDFTADKLSDSILYVLDKSKKLKKKISPGTADQKAVKSLFEKAELEFLKPAIEQAILKLKETGILTPETPSDASQIPDKLKGRFLTLGMFITRLENSKK